jgi:hypothetical protein
MATLEIVLDRYRRYHSHGTSAFSVDTEGQYREARRAIRAALRSGDRLVVIVLNPKMATWFDDLKRDSRVEIIEYTARQQVAMVLGIMVSEMPELLTEELCESLDLAELAMSLPRQPGERVLSWVLRVVVGDPWGKNEIAPADICAALVALANCKAQLELISPLLAQQVGRWSQRGTWSTGWCWLQADWQHRARCLLVLMATGGYGEVSRQWLVQEEYHLDTIEQAAQVLEEGLLTPHVLSDIPISQRLSATMGIELRDRLTRDGVTALPPALLGLNHELQTVSQYLESRAEEGLPLSVEEASQLLDWIAPHASSGLGLRIKLMAQLLSSGDGFQPSPMPVADGWIAIERWLTDAYLPWYVLCAVTGKLEETTEHVAGFEKWLLENYRSLHMHKKLGPQQFLDGLHSWLEQGAVMVLLLDGAPHAALELIATDFCETDILLHDRTVLALLPSVTRSNKPAILTGRLPDQASSTGAEQIARALGLDHHQVTVTRTKDLSKLGSLTPMKGELHIFDYHEIDEELLHKPMTPLRRWTECLLRAQAVADEVSALLKRAEDSGTSVWVGCISDHGWTELPQSACRVLVDEELTDCIQHGRVLKGTATPASGHALKAEQHFVEQDCTMATGYSYMGPRPRGAVHGGATAQEITVRGLWLTNSNRADMQDLMVQAVGPVIRRRGRNPVTLRITNPNSSPAKIESIDIMHIHTQQVSWPVGIPPHASAEMAVLVDASGFTDEQVQVEGTIVWLLDVPTGATRHRQPARIVLTATGAALSNKAFDDMFRE